MDKFGYDIERLILSHYKDQRNPFILRQVCKRWNKIVERQNSEPLYTIIDYNASCGYLSILKWIQQSHPECFLESNAILYAAKSGDLDTVQWVHSNGHELYEGVFDAAAKSGNVQLLSWLKANKCYRRYSIWSNAALGGHVPAFKWIQENDFTKEFSPPRCIPEAIKSHNIEMFRHVYSSGFKLNMSDIDTAILESQWEILSLLEEAGLQVNDFNAHNFCRVGNLPLYKKYATSKPREEDILDAIAGGHIEILEYFRSLRVVWKEIYCAEAAKSGQFEALKWLIENGCPTDSFLIGYLAQKGSLEIFKWCIDHGCEFSGPEHYARIVVGRGCVDIVDFLWKNYNHIFTVNRIFYEAASSGNIEMLQWCKNNNIPFISHFVLEAAKNGHLESLKWLKANSTAEFVKTWNNGEAGRHPSREASAGGHLHCLKWLLANGISFQYTPGIISNGHLNVLKYANKKKLITWTKDDLKDVSRSYSYEPHIVRWVKAQCGAANVW